MNDIPLTTFVIFNRRGIIIKRFTARRKSEKEHDADFLSRVRKDHPLALFDPDGDEGHRRFNKHKGGK